MVMKIGIHGTRSDKALMILDKCHGSALCPHGWVCTVIAEALVVT